MTTRIFVTLEPEERTALAILAKKEMRPLRDQIRFLLRQELTKRDLLINQDQRKSLKSTEGIADGH